MSRERIPERELARVFEHQLSLPVRPVTPDREASGLTGRADLVWYEARIGPERRVIIAEVKSAPAKEVDRLKARARRVHRDHPDSVYLVVAPTLSKRAREELRAHHVNHADLRGNIWIHEPGFYVNVEGDLPSRHVRAGPGPSPFSKKASLVPRTLLELPEQHWGVREMSAETGLAVGYASEVLREMARRGYVVERDGGYGLGDAVRLLQDWSEAYSWGKNEIHSFVAAFGKEELIRLIAKELEPAGDRYALTLLTGSDFVAPHVQHNQVHVYVEESARDRILDFARDRLYAEPVRSGGNLHLLVPYYREAVFHGSRSVEGVPVVSNVQLFLDLVRYPVRGEEAAGALVRKALAPRLGLDREQRDALLAAVES